MSSGSPRKLKKHRVFYMGEHLVITTRAGGAEPYEVPNEREWLAAGIREFRMALRAYEARRRLFRRVGASRQQEAPF
jgi:hypothetical protein